MYLFSSLLLNKSVYLSPVDDTLIRANQKDSLRNQVQFVRLFILTSYVNPTLNAASIHYIISSWKRSEWRCEKNICIIGYNVSNSWNVFLRKRELPHMLSIWYVPSVLVRYERTPPVWPPPSFGIREGFREGHRRMPAGLASSAIEALNYEEITQQSVILFPS